MKFFALNAFLVLGLCISLNAANFSIGRGVAELENQRREQELRRYQLEQEMKQRQAILDQQRREFETRNGGRVSALPINSPDFREVIGYTVTTVDTVMQYTVRERNRVQYIFMKLANGNIWQIKYAPLPDIIPGKTQVIIFEKNSKEIKFLINGIFLQVAR